MLRRQIAVAWSTERQVLLQWMSWSKLLVYSTRLLGSGAMYDMGLKTAWWQQKLSNLIVLHLGLECLHHIFPKDYESQERR